MQTLYYNPSTHQVSVGAPLESDAFQMSAAQIQAFNPSGQTLSANQGYSYAMPGINAGAGTGVNLNGAAGGSPATSISPYGGTSTNPSDALPTTSAPSVTSLNTQPQGLPVNLNGAAGATNQSTTIENDPNTGKPLAPGQSVTFQGNTYTQGQQIDPTTNLPITSSSSTSGSSSGSGSQSSGGNSSSTSTNSGSTGDPSTDAALAAMQAEITAQAAAGQIPAGLQVTPAMTAQFLAQAHENVDPQTQQYIQTAIAGINANTQEMQTAFQQNETSIGLGYMQNLATEQNASGEAGISQSGVRNNAENMMTNNANLSLAQNANTSALAIGNNLRTGASQVGSQYSGQLINPTLSYDSLTNQGGIGPSEMGTQNSGAGGALNLNYDPSLYQVGTIPTQQSGVVAQTAANLNSQYLTLAGNPSNSNQTVANLMGQLSPELAVPNTGATSLS